MQLREAKLDLVRSIYPPRHATRLLGSITSNFGGSEAGVAPLFGDAMPAEGW